MATKRPPARDVNIVYVSVMISFRVKSLHLLYTCAWFASCGPCGPQGYNLLFNNVSCACVMTQCCPAPRKNVMFTALCGASCVDYKEFESCACYPNSISYPDAVLPCWMFLQDDLKDLGFPKGPRIKLLHEVQNLTPRA